MRYVTIKPNDRMGRFGLWLVGYIVKHNLSLNDFSRLAGYPAPTISHWIYGTRLPTLPSIIMVVETIMKIDETPLDDLLMEAIKTFDEYVYAVQRRDKIERAAHKVCDNIERGGEDV